MDGVDVNMRISSGLQDERSSGFWLAKTTASADVSAAVAQGRLPCIYRLLGGATGPVGAQKVGADAKRLVLNEKSKRRKRKRKKQKKKKKKKSCLYMPFSVPYSRTGDWPSW